MNNWIAWMVLPLALGAQQEGRHTRALAPSQGYSYGSVVTNAKPGDREQRIHMFYRVVRVEYDPSRKAPSAPQVVQTKTGTIGRNLRPQGIRMFSATKEGKRVPVELSVTTKQSSEGIGTRYYAFNITVSPQFEEDGSVTLPYTLVTRGAYPSQLSWAEMIQKESTSGQVHLVSGQPPVRIAGVTNSANPEIRSHVLRGELPESEQAYTVYFLEIRQEAAPPQAPATKPAETP